MICDGLTYEEANERVAGHVRDRGFSQLHVKPDDQRMGYAYTIGLVVRGHPELVVLNLKQQAAARVLDALGRRVLAGESLATGEPIIEGPDVLEVVPVHEWYLRRGLLASWQRWCDGLDAPRPALAALQVLPPSSWFCCEHQGSQRRLDRPGPGLVRGPNRETRRRRPRRRP